MNLAIPKGTTFSYGGKNYITTQAASVNATEDALEGGPFIYKLKTISSGAIPVVAAENGEAYNINAAASGWSASIRMTSGAAISSSAMTGGTSKIVTTVTDKDMTDAEASLDMNVEGEARDELAEQFGDEYLLITNSFSAGEAKVTTSPALNEEVGEGVTPQIIKEIQYKIYAVRRDDIERYIKKLTEANLGDDTQMIHDTGIDKAFIDAFKDDGEGKHSGKLKSIVKIGPKITEADIMEKSLGKRLGEVQTMNKSIKGVTEVEVKPSYFWVTKVPKNQNKVHIELKTDEE